MPPSYLCSQSRAGLCGANTGRTGPFRDDSGAPGPGNNRASEPRRTDLDQLPGSKYLSHPGRVSYNNLFSQWRYGGVSMMGQVTIFNSILTGMYEGRFDYRKHDCWLMLIDFPITPSILNSLKNPTEHEIPEAPNYQKGGKHIGPITVTPDKHDGIHFGWNTPKLLWPREGFLPHGLDPRPPSTGPIQKPRWGIIYSKVPITPIAYVDLGGAYDFRDGKLTISLKQFPEPEQYTLFDNWFNKWFGRSE